MKLELWAVEWSAVPGQELGPLLAQHLAYVIALEGRGQVFASGPLLDEKGTNAGAGLTILHVANEDEARLLADADPFLLAGARTYRLRKWIVVEGSMNVSLRFSDASFRFPDPWAPRTQGAPFNSDLSRAGAVKGNLSR